MREKTSVIGIDVGTSGCRGVVLDAGGNALAEAGVALPAAHCSGAAVEQSPQHWWQALQELMPRLLQGVATQHIRALAIDATSGTTLLCDREGIPCSAALMYNDNRAVDQARRIAAVAPRESAAHGTGSGLAKAMWLLQHHHDTAAGVHTQTDWLSGMLCGDFRYCDTNSALKLGYDPLQRRWPAWLERLGIDESRLPEVVSPGSPIGTLRPALAAEWGLGAAVQVCAGTTDSTAAIIAAGARRPGEAVTSLGSTLVVKILSERPLFAPEYGIYSQPMGKLWLVGGGSNSGGAVLRHFFSDAQMAQLGRQLEPDKETGLHYYPLLSAGERFPVNDATLAPRLSPRPESDARFFQGLLEGIARIEKQGYDRLAELGAPRPVNVRSIGGGARNAAWTRIRGRLLGVPMLAAEHRQACYGAARLALDYIDSTSG